MKKQLLILSLFCSTLFSLSAQGFDFAPVGARWYYSELDFALKDIPHITESVGKETYQGKWCSKLIHSSMGPLPSPTYVYTQNDTVFFYSTLTNQFEMLYDFTAEVGDSWVVGGVHSVDNEGNHLLADTVRVDSMSTVILSGDTLKVWYISHGFFYDWGRRIIEKVGNDDLFAPKYAMWELQIGALRCFETPDVEFHFVPYPCDTVYSTISSSYDLNGMIELEIFPNPSTGHAAVLLPTNAAGVVAVFSSTGHKIYTETVVPNTNSLVLDLSQMPVGLYRVVLFDVEHRAIATAPLSIVR